MAQVQELRQLLDNQRKELNDCRAEITALKMHIAGSHPGNTLVVNNFDESFEKYKEEIESLQLEIEKLKGKDGNAAANSIDSDKVLMESVGNVNSVDSDQSFMQSEENVVEIHEDNAVVSRQVDKAMEVIDNIIGQSLDDQSCNAQDLLKEPLIGPSDSKDVSTIQEGMGKQNGETPSGDRELLVSDNNSGKAASEKIVSACRFYLVTLLSYF